ncbi:hypothetical protein ADICYQ_4548 [Cyclobacterium qasimii M12-11B]|uniref:Uncharacterized protein n=1 Tax=Cyclobacterium qasimii M12-11B TaxID=641524 RepID=S7WI52_9BACT|nr:hypothetical protein ADICYQ_4548 [Cyclobacterium qasimii M12-11B]
MVFYLAIIIGVFYLIYTWVNKFISLKKEQNDLLREIVKKMDKSQ